jgi:hypothetical protein
MHFLAWLLPLAFLNTEVDKIRGWCTLAAFAVAGLFQLPCHVLLRTASHLWSQSSWCSCLSAPRVDSSNQGQQLPRPPYAQPLPVNVPFAADLVGGCPNSCDGSWRATSTTCWCMCSPTMCSSCSMSFLFSARFVIQRSQSSCPSGRRCMALCILQLLGVD